MSQPGVPASGGAPPGPQAQNGAASASGFSYTNGPVQNASMSSPVSVNHGYNSQLPGSYHLPAKTSLNPVSGWADYGGFQTASSINSYQGPGQTLNRPHMASSTMTPSLHGVPVSQMPPSASQNSAATPMPSGSFLPGVNLPAPTSNWQYNSPSTGSQINQCPRVSTQPTVSGNTNLITNHQYISSGDPSFQNSYIKSGSAPPLLHPPLPTTFQPGAPLGPPPVGGPPPVRALTPQSSSHNAVPQPSFNSAINQEGGTSNTNNGSMLVHNSYDEIEGGGFLGEML